MAKVRRSRGIRHSDNLVKNMKEKHHYNLVTRTLDAQSTVNEGLDFNGSDELQKSEVIEEEVIRTRKPSILKLILNHFQENLGEYIIYLVVITFCGFVLMYIFNHNKDYGILDTKYEHLSETLKISQESINEKLKQEIERINLSINDLKLQAEKLEDKNINSRQDILDRIRNLEIIIIELKITLKNIINL